MTDKLRAEILHQHMAHMVVLEADVEKAVEPLLHNGHPEIAAMAGELRAMAKTQGQAFAARLHAIAGNEIPDAGFDDPLRHLHLAVIKALVGYAKMQVLARRFGHGSPTSEGETDDLGQQHSLNYVKALQGINRLLHDIVLWELDQDGLSCQCPCPCCSLGVCLCAVSSRAMQRNAWAGGPVAGEAGVFVHSPPKTSAAAKAGLRHGDIILAADGQEVDGFAKLQAVVKGHQSRAFPNRKCSNI